MIRTRLLGIAILSVISVAACSSGSKSGRPTGSIKVGTSSSASNVGLYEASIAGGSFSKHGLNATLQVVTSGAQAVPLLLNGQLQFSAADPLSAMVAISKKAPLVIVGTGNSIGPDAAHDNVQLVVKRADGFAASNLAGKTIAVNALNSLSEVAARAAIDKAGGDSSKVKFIALPFSESNDAVTRGTVYAAVTGEPFLTAAKQSGLQVAMPLYSSVLPGAPQLVYVATKKYVASHSSLVKGFADSIAEANTALSKDPAELKKVAVTSTNSTSSVIDSIILPVFTPSIVQISTLKYMQQLMVKYGVLTSTFDPTPNIFAG